MLAVCATYSRTGVAWTLIRLWSSSREVRWREGRKRWGGSDRRGHYGPGCNIVEPPVMDVNNWRWIRNCRDIRKIGEAIIVFMTSIYRGIWKSVSPLVNCSTSEYCLHSTLNPVAVT